MTFLAKDIRDHLAGSVAILNGFSDRMYGEFAPQEERDSGGDRRLLYPCIVISDVSAEPEYSLRGEVGTHKSIIQLDVWTDGTGGKQRANELGELVRNRMSGYRGQFGTGCYGTSHMVRCNSLASPPTEASDRYRRRVSMDFEIVHTADVPSLS